MWARRSGLNLNSLTPSRSWTKFEGGKKGLNVKSNWSEIWSKLWIHTKAAVCNGQRHMKNFRIHKMNSIVEAVNGAWRSGGGVELRPRRHSGWLGFPRRATKNVSSIRLQHLVSL